MNTTPHTPSDPIARFQETLARAKAATRYVPGPGVMSAGDPTAMTLATADGEGRPSARIVLLKAVDARGFVFYTNRESRKGHELGANPNAALCFLWAATAEQVRVEGRVERATEEESDAYFASRARDSQIGAWASLQSETLGERRELLDRIREIEARYEGKPVQRPAHWGGYRVVPSRIEFWKEEAFRIHDRDVYERATAGVPWSVRKLYP